MILVIFSYHISMIIHHLIEKCVMNASHVMIDITQKMFVEQHFYTLMTCYMKTNQISQSLTSVLK